MREGEDRPPGDPPGARSSIAKPPQPGLSRQRCRQRGPESARRRWSGWRGRWSGSRGEGSRPGRGRRAGVDSWRSSAPRRRAPANQCAAISASRMGGWGARPNTALPDSVFRWGMARMGQKKIMASCHDSCVLCNQT